MESQVCVNCRNEKTVNSTTNRLVTESCGHVKCIDCLIHEKNGCLACLDAKNGKSDEDNLRTEDKQSDENEPLHEEDKDISSDSRPSSEPHLYESLTKKRKPETSHIKIETDANGRCYVCTLCDKKFHARSQVAYHAYCNGQRKPYQCLECYKSFATLSHYKYHMQVHRNERSYACEICGDGFFQKSKLQRHKLTHTKEKNYVCGACNKAFNNVSSLRKHELTHTEERPYQCTVCGRRIRDSSNYRKHLDRHAGSEKCTCVPCVSGSGRCTGRGGGGGGGGGGGVGRGVGGGGEGGAGRRGARQLRRHQCPRCPQAFQSSKDMRRHAAVHTDTKPFRCKVCKRRFRRKDNLERHIRNTHPDFVTSSAVECDETALKEISTNGQPPPQHDNQKSKLVNRNPLPPLPQELMHKHMHGAQNDAQSDALHETQRDAKHDAQHDAKHDAKHDVKHDAKHDVKHDAKHDVKQDVKQDVKHDDKHDAKHDAQHDVKRDEIDKSYILVANNARQSVIVGKGTAKLEKATSPPECEYVHKIRKANSMASHNNIPLPPIDEKKMLELNKKGNLDAFEVGAPPKERKKVYEMIMYDDADKREPDADSILEPSDSHWKRRKMKLNMNW